MKKIRLIIFCIVIVVLLTACAASGNTEAISASAPQTAPTAPGAASESVTATPANAFSVTSMGIKNGYIDPAYGQNGSALENGIPTLSLPLNISGAPEGTACYALMMDDPDSEPLCGYAWVHWMAAGFTQTSLPEGFSAAAGDDVVQGKNDSGTIGYAGPTPPDKDHTYRITVYALDSPPNLQSGFSKEDFAAALEGHVLAQATIEGIYKK